MVDTLTPGNDNDRKKKTGWKKKTPRVKGKKRGAKPKRKGAICLVTEGPTEKKGRGGEEGGREGPKSGCGTRRTPNESGGKKGGKGVGKKGRKGKGTDRKTIGNEGEGENQM